LKSDVETAVETAVFMLRYWSYVWQLELSSCYACL